MKKSIYTTILILLVVTNIVGFCMAVSEGSRWFWANFVGLALFGGSSYLLGLFKDPHERKSRRETT